MDHGQDGERDVLFSFGLITDIQYADISVRQNSSNGRWRRYRNALFCLQQAVTHWKTVQTMPAFIVQLGDIIDGFNASLVDANDNERNFSKEALDAVMKEFSKLPHEMPVFHNLGNHELYNFSRRELASSVLHPFNTCASASYLDLHQSHPVISKGETKSFYFSFTPHPKFCFVYLDSYDISILGEDESSPRYKQGIRMIRRHNKNDDLECLDGLNGLERRFVEFNGAIGTTQLSWLDNVLQQAQKNGQKVVIFCHVPIHPGNRKPLDLLWDYEDVIEVLWRFPCVVACLHGHTHEADYYLDKNGIHHLAFEAVVEAPVDSNAFATLHVKNDAIVIEGFGVIQSQVLKFSH